MSTSTETQPGPQVQFAAPLGPMCPEPPIPDTGAPAAHRKWQAARRNTLELEFFAYCTSFSLCGLLAMLCGLWWLLEGQSPFAAIVGIGLFIAQVAWGAGGIEYLSRRVSLERRAGL